MRLFRCRKAEVRGGSITHKKLASASRRLDEQIKQSKAGPVSRKSLKESGQPISPRSPTSPSSRLNTKVYPTFSSLTSSSFTITMPNVKVL